MSGRAFASPSPLAAAGTLFIALFLVQGCGSDDDGGDPPITFDASVSGDAGMDAGDDAAMDAGNDSGAMVTPPPAPSVCGNGDLEAGESCDDGNTSPGDGCSDTCAWEALCGDGTKDNGEVCDDGNNVSGDGCSADCLSSEQCGNGIRDLAAGEACDDGNTVDGDLCSATCAVVLGCGNGAVADGEQCDDSNMDNFDGCGADCRQELAFVLSSLEFKGSGGCDFSGDGAPDNAFGKALGAVIGLVNQQFPMQIASGDLIGLIRPMDLDDLTGTTDTYVGVQWASGVDADEPADPDNNLDGSGQFLISATDFDAEGKPVSFFEGALANGGFSGGPTSVAIAAGPLPLQMQQASITGTAIEAEGRWSSISNGQLCGVVPMTGLAQAPNFAAGMGPAPCDGSSDGGSMADLLVAGMEGLISLGGVGPDVDLDGDGLERYEALVGPDCQGVIVACVDGDGTRIEGRGCAADPRMVDGYSSASAFAAVSATIKGVAPAM